MKTSYGSIQLSPTISRQLGLMTAYPMTELDTKTLLKQLLTHAENLESRIATLERASVDVAANVGDLADVSVAPLAGDATDAGVVGVEKRRIRRKDPSVDGTG
jgi:hypothetical protein